MKGFIPKFDLETDAKIEVNNKEKPVFIELGTEYEECKDCDCKNGECKNKK